jgi:hypothetical protein
MEKRLTLLISMLAISERVGESLKKKADKVERIIKIMRE